jgi:Domain of unknown function (DUF4145)
MKTSRAPCSYCLIETEHNELHSVDRSYEGAIWHFTLLECAGCKAILLREGYSTNSSDYTDIRYYPSPASRRVHDWVYDLSVGVIGGPRARFAGLGDLFLEIYQAVRGGQLRLAIMGIRALIEQVMIHKVGDKGTFAKNLEAFQQARYISLVQRDALNDILDAGHAAIHRSYTPTEKDIQIALDIIEGVMAAIFVHADAAKKVSERYPRGAKLPTVHSVRPPYAAYSRSTPGCQSRARRSRQSPT